MKLARRSITKLGVGVALLLGAGCHKDAPFDPSTAIEAQLISATGRVGSRELAFDPAMTVFGSRFGSLGSFQISNGASFLVASTCGLDGDNTDPYNTGSPPQDPPSLDMAGANVDGGGVVGSDTALVGNAVAGIECKEAGVYTCTDDTCTTFDATHTSIAIVDAGAWRELTFVADSADGNARVNLRYRERTK